MKNVALNITAVLLLSLAVSAGFADTTYTGSLGSGNGSYSSQLTNGGSTSGGGYWEGSSQPTISWNVTGSGSSWNYSYTLTDNYSTCPTLPYMLLETSTTFTSSDISSMTGGTDSVGTFTSGTYPNLPRSLYGLKLTPGSAGNTETFSFHSDRAPVWGDFYTQGDASYTYYAWNSGFASNDPDPVAGAPANGGLDITSGSPQGWYLLVPDTSGGGGSSTPEPGSLGLGLCALGLAVGALRRRKAAKRG
jgi:hypothetical protein